jgi:flagellar motor switch/type III secretory pathway protein FliN
MPWSPIGPTQVDRARAAITPSLEQFGRDWFDDTAAVRLDTLKAISRPERITEEWRVWQSGDDLQVAASPFAMRSLAEAALGYRGATAASNPTEARILDAVARRQLAALLHGIGGRLGLPRKASMEAATTAAGPRGFAGVVGMISIANRPAQFALAIGARLLWRARADTRREHRHSLVARRQAVMDSPVPLVSVIGRTDLSLSQLAAMAKGDVLLVGRHVNEPLPVRVGTTTPHLAAYPCAVGQRRGVQFVSLNR